MAALTSSHPSSRMRIPVALLASALVLNGLAIQPSTASAQGDGWTTTSLTGELAFLSFNTLGGALTAGIRAGLRGDRFSDAAIAGAVGGATAYAGKRVAVFDFPGAGFLGRQINAAGGSIIENASQGADAFSRFTIVLPVMRLDASLASRRLERVRFSVPETLVLIGAMRSQAVELDWRESLSSGAPVFRVHDGRYLDSGGNMYYGVITLGDLSGSQHQRTLRHERVHVLQRDLVKEGWTDPLERWLLARVFGDVHWIRFIDTDVLSQLVPSPAAEAEADFLEGR